MKPSPHRVSAAVAAAILCLGAALTACSGDEPKTTAPTNASLNHQTGVMTFPIDSWRLSPEEMLIIETANDLITARCMSKAGFGRFFPFADHRGREPVAERRYGIWLKDSAARWGYDDPPPSALAKHLDALNAIPFTAEAESALTQCINEKVKAGFVKTAAMAAGEGLQVEAATSAIESDEAGDIQKEWRACLRDHDVTPPPAQEWEPKDVHGSSKAQAIHIALIDVACKEKLGTLNQMATLEANFQLAEIKKNEAELKQGLKDAQVLLARSRAYLAKHGLSEAP